MPAVLPDPIGVVRQPAVRPRRALWLAAVGVLATAFGVSGAGLVWHQDGSVRWADVRPWVSQKPGLTGFTPVPAATSGVRFTNRLDELAGAANRVLYNGSGVAVGDYDGDGLPDLFFCNLSGPQALFRNLGDWRFTNTTAAAGLAAPVPQCRGAVFADVNADGALDLLLAVTGRGVLCFQNDGQGRFRDVTAAAGTASPFGSQTMTLADVDGNGTLDLYVANNRSEDIRDRGQAKVTMVNGRPVMAGTETNRFVILDGRLEERGQPDQLFLNDGAGRFQAVPWSGGAFVDESGQPLTEPPLDWGLTATFRDLNDDLAPDLYVCNDYWTPDRCWINDGRGRFRALDRPALRKTPASSMSVDLADIDRDGHLDLFAVDMLSRYPHLRKRQLFAQMPKATPPGPGDDRPQVMRNTLFLGRGDGTFAEIAYYANVPASDWSWAPIFVDVDLDGYEDLLIGAGYFRDVQDYDTVALIQSRQHPWTGFASDAARQQAFTQELMEHFRLYPELQLPIGGWRNQGDGTFREMTDAWGLTEPGIHQGLALADLDLDGDLDLVVNNLNGPAALLRNDSPAARVAVRLAGRAPNTQGIGAKVALLGGAIPRQATEVICGGRYQSGCDTEVVFAAGPATNGMTIEVRWRNGARSVVPGVQPNRVYEIQENGSTPFADPPRARPVPVFDDVSELLGHRHAETEFDDYERQPLLPFKLSQLGPGVAWCDLDGDQRDELILGAGRGSALAVYRLAGSGGFTAVGPAPALPDDTSGLVGWATGTNTVLLVGTTGYEAKAGQAGTALRLEGDRWQTAGALIPEMSGAGALALGDRNGDGQMALFLAGGVTPGSYPLGARSLICRWDGAQWRPSVKESTLLANLGVVNGAVWSDLDGDGLPELILACEWGPIRVFRSRGPAWFEVTTELGLNTRVGWWRGVTTGDLNNDGRLDIVASNWGLNSPYRATDTAPLVFFHGQLAQPGVTDIIETEYDKGVLVPRRQFMAMLSALPFLSDRFASHKAYSEATVEEMLGERLVLARRVTATTLASTVFLNTGAGFVARELPREAQFAPAFSVNVADFDGDGNEDVFLSQNFFGLQPETTRVDAGMGLWLQGDGAGGLTAVPSARSGVNVPGEQRGAAIGDYDEDGRVDLVVSQNGATTRLFHNVGAKPGLRVRLAGPPGNPRGVGAVLRLQFKDRMGPARELHAGSGYWSQDSLVTVMATPQPPDGIWIRWPGGRVTTTPLSPGLREVTVNLEGAVLARRASAETGSPAR